MWTIPKIQPLVHIQIRWLMMVDCFERTYTAGHMGNVHMRMITRNISCVVWSCRQTLSSDGPLCSLTGGWPSSHMLFLFPDTMAPNVCHKMFQTLHQQRRSGGVTANDVLLSSLYLVNKVCIDPEVQVMIKSVHLEYLQYNTANYS